MDQKERNFRFAMSQINGLGIKRYLEILNHFQSAIDFWNSNTQDIIDIFGKNIGTKICRERDVIDINSKLKLLKNLNINFMVFGEESYPTLLSEISDPPVCIFYKGNAPKIIFDNSITIVGTRKHTKYGEEIIKKIIPELVKKNITIVSGMAFGIDKVAHEVVLDNGGVTIAVLGSSVDNPTPMSNRSLYEEIINHGIVLSEYFPGTEVAPGNFPSRNRILAGLSMATVLIEAPERSGALITAHLAFDYNRMVFAVPGSVGKISSKGCNNLIKNQKAKLIEDAFDIFIELGYQIGKEQNFDIHREVELGLDQKQREILAILKYQALTFDQMKQKFDMDVKSLLVSLTTLEVSGLIFRNEKEEYVVRL